MLIQQHTCLIDLEESIEETIDYYIAESIRCCMKERDYYILCMRLGLIDGEKKTLREIGEEFGLTRERIRQVENKCYRLLRYYSHKKLEKNHDRYVVRYLYTLLSKWISPDEEPDTLYIASLVHRINKTQYTRLIVSLFYPSEEATQKEREALSIIKDIFLKQKEIQKQNYNQTTKFDKLFQGVAWPKTTTILDPDELTNFKPQRQVNHDNDSVSGKFFSEKNRCIIEYESSIEYRFCMYLEYLKDVKQYRQQPIKIPYNTNGHLRYYYPDFLVMFEDGRCVVVEIKPRAHMMQYHNILKYMALQKYCIEKGYGYLIAEGYRSINEIVYHKIDQVRLIKLISCIKPYLNWPEYKKIREELSLSLWETNAFILHGNLKFTTSPYSIKHSGISYQEFIELHKDMTLTTAKQEKDDYKQTNDSIQINKDHIAKRNLDRGRQLNEYSRWTNDEEELLIKRYKEGISLTELSHMHQRGEKSISKRLTRLNIVINESEENTKYLNENKDKYQFPLKPNDKNIALRNKRLGLPLNSHSKWSSEEDTLLTQRFKEGLCIADLSNIHCRKEGGIIARLKKLGLIEDK